ncbi:hypothetical protein [Trichormus azollae]|jgi:hypothetical protein|uniref:hypothetical protein n=1 Tax=Trichormus azollae TaxID=1164 RepID=UPI0001956CE8|nr:hypothetical protein [Trichormus azollae]
MTYLILSLEKRSQRDITLFQEDRSKFAKNQRFKGDLAYQGGDLISTPVKKPKKRELTQEQENKNSVLNECLLNTEFVLSKYFELPRNNLD